MRAVYTLIVLGAFALGMWIITSCAPAAPAVVPSGAAAVEPGLAAFCAQHVGEHRGTCPQ